MKNANIWQPYTEGEGYAYAYGFEGLKLEQERAVLSGERLAEPFPTITLSRLSDGPLPDALGVPSAYLVASESLRCVLEATGALMQPIPVKIKGRHLHYTLLNILNHVSALDWNHSDYELLPGTNTIWGLSRLTLRPIPSDAPAIFHLAELPAVLMVSDALRHAMTEASQSPGHFVAVEDFKID